MKAWSILPCLNGSGWWWCNSVGDIFLTHFGPLSINWAPFKTPTWVLLLTMSIPLWLQCTHLLMYFQQDNAQLSQSSNQLRLVSWTWQWVHFTQMASTVTRSQSNRAPLGCGGTGDWHHGCAADKPAATAWCYHVNMEQNYLDLIWIWIADHFLIVLL